MKKEELIAYREGYLRALWLFSYYKDGEQYVGSTGKTYRRAKVEFEKDYEQRLKKIAG